MSDLISPAYTRALGEVIREIEPSPQQYRGIELMPAVERPTNDVYIDIFERSGGMTLEATFDADTQSIQKKGFRTEKFSSGAYREMIRFGESDILRLRELGTNDLTKRGIQQHMEENARRLNTRIETRMEVLRWQALLNGSYVYDGKMVNFGVPAVNNVSPLQPWATIVNGVPTANAQANPIHDLRFWAMGGYAPYRIYGPIKKMWMNPTTARMFIENANVMQGIQQRFAAENFPSYDISAVLKFLIPGVPDVEIYSGTYLSEAVDGLTGKITTSYATYFIPDGKILFTTDLPDGNKLGEVQMTLNLSNGNPNAPATGKYLITDLSGMQSLQRAPYIALIAGFNGGPALTRPFDVLSATVF